MMRNTLLSRAQANSSLGPSSALDTATPHQAAPTIRLISATPSATGSAADRSTSFSSAVAPFASSSPLAPRNVNEAPRKKLIPKKSKLGLLGGNKAKDKAAKDLSDVARRVGGGTASTGRGGFEIYVDHAEDPELGDIVVVKKRKSRLGLDGMRWGTLGEVTNVPSAPKEEKKTTPSVEYLKPKDENQKWWSIGRGRKDSKGKEEKGDREKSQTRSKSAYMRAYMESCCEDTNQDPSSCSSGSFEADRYTRTFQLFGLWMSVIKPRP